MQAVEFEADTNNGVIVIPELYRHALSSTHLRVILLCYEADSVKKEIPKGFFNPVEVPSYKLVTEREEIYGR